MRYLPHTETEISEMLKVIGAKSLDDLFSSIPKDLRLKNELKIPHAKSELEILKELEGITAKNKTNAISFLGAGAYRHHIPSALSMIVGRSEFITPYTPYQPEISQGTLQTVFEYQTMICRLFAMDLSNASHYDGATSTAEAALLAVKMMKKKKILIADTVHPEYIETIRTMLKPSSVNIVIINHTDEGRINLNELKSSITDSAGLIVGYPNFFGVIEDLKEISEIVHNAGGIFITSTQEPTSLGLIEAPGNLGVDIACAEGQAFGVGLNFGGPNLGIFAAKEKFLRSFPGRIVGKTLDSDGKESYVLTFATREQHIRREKATSNICSNQALCATMAAVYLALLGKEGLSELAEINFSRAAYAKKKLNDAGFKIRFTGETFNEFVVDIKKPAEDAVKKLAHDNIFAGVALSKWFKDLKTDILVSVTELNSKEDIDKLVDSLKKI